MWDPGQYLAAPYGAVLPLRRVFAVASRR